MAVGGRLHLLRLDQTGNAINIDARARVHYVMMADHPGVIFKDGPTGRRAALAYGPDVWEVVKFLREVDERGPAALDATADVFAVDVKRISTAVSYYGHYRNEIDAEIAAAEEASVRAERAWRVQQRLIA